jgi:hypothetical protein
MSNKFSYDIMSDIYKNILEQLKFSETKNNILTTIIVAVTVLYIRFYFYIECDLEKNILLKITFFLMFTMLIISLYHILKSFYPNLDNSDNKDYNDIKDKNIYYFNDISKFKPNEYLIEVLKKSNIDDNTNKDQLLDISNQIITLSKITIYKLNCFKSSMSVFSFFIFLFLVFYSIVYWS